MHTLRQSAYIRPDEQRRPRNPIAWLGLVLHKCFHAPGKKIEGFNLRLGEKIVNRLMRNQNSLLGVLAKEMQPTLHEKRIAIETGVVEDRSPYVEEIREALLEQGVEEGDIDERATALDRLSQRLESLSFLNRDLITRIWPFATNWFRFIIPFVLAMDAFAYKLESIFSRRKRAKSTSNDALEYTFAVLPVSIKEYRKNEEVPNTFDDLVIPDTTYIGWNPVLYDLQLAVLTHIDDAEYKRAFDGVLAAYRVIETLLDTLLGATAESKQELLKSVEFWMGIGLQLIQMGFRPNPVELGTFYDHILRFKAIEIDILTIRHRTAATAPPKTRSLYKRIMPSLEERIEASIKRMHNESLRAKSQARRFQRREDMAEIYLAMAVLPDDIAKVVESQSWERIIDRIPPKAVLFDFRRYRSVDIDHLRSTSVAKYGADRYLVFVTHGSDVEYSDLGEAAPLDKLILAHVRELCGEQLDPFGRNIVETTTRQEPSSKMLWQISARALGERLLKPHRSTLESADHIIVSPDSTLNRLPFETLILDAETLLVDRLCVSYLDSPRDLNPRPHSPNPNLGSPCIVGNPDFEAYGSRNEGGFAALPATRDEVETIARMLGITPLTREFASATEVKRQKSPRILHIATHGYYLNADMLQDKREARSFVEPDRLSILATLDNPLLRSGLALAGANTWMAGGKLTHQAENALLTAADVAEMDLSGTELVVLSACETGLGDAKSGQGVFGLRRTFAIAGAHSLVMSLWKVPDEPTRLLMEAFYQHLLDGKGRAEALRDAQFDLRLVYPHPCNWAAFICVGDIDPLSTGASSIGKSGGKSVNHD